MSNYCHAFIDTLDLSPEIRKSAVELEAQVHIKSLLYRLAEIFKPGYPQATESQMILAAGYGYCVHQSLFLPDEFAKPLMQAAEQKLADQIGNNNPFWQKKQALEQQNLWQDQQVSDAQCATFKAQQIDEQSLEHFQQLQIRHRSYGLFFPLILQALAVDQKISSEWCIELISFYLKIFGYIYDADALLEPGAEEKLSHQPVFSTVMAKNLLEQHQLGDIANQQSEVNKTVFASGIYQIMMEQAIEQCRLGNLHLDLRPDLPVTRGRMLFRAFEKKCRQQIRSLEKLYAS